MKIGARMQDAIGKQINAELYSAYLYLSMCAYFESNNLKGFGQWMKVQAKEEVGHAMRFYDYAIERGGSVTLTAIDKPPSAWKSPLAAFEDAYKHELKVTELIGGLFRLASEEKDLASKSMLRWFVDEQVEEEASADEIVQKLRLVGDSGSGLLRLDHKLGKRGKEKEGE